MFFIYFLGRFIIKKIHFIDSFAPLLLPSSATYLLAFGRRFFRLLKKLFEHFGNQLFLFNSYSLVSFVKGKIKLELII